MFSRQDRSVWERAVYATLYLPALILYRSRKSKMKRLIRLRGSDNRTIVDEDHPDDGKEEKQKEGACGSDDDDSDELQRASLHLRASFEHDVTLQRRVVSSCLAQMTFGCLREFARRRGNAGSGVDVIPDFALVTRLKHTALSHGLVRAARNPADGDKRSDIRWTFRFPRAASSSDHVTALHVHADDGLTIVSSDGVRHRRGGGARQTRAWKLAKAHAQAQLTRYGSFELHRRRHHCPVTRFVDRRVGSLPQGGVLRALLSGAPSGGGDKVDYHRCPVGSSDPLGGESRGRTEPWRVDVSDSSDVTDASGGDLEDFYTKFDDRLVYQYYLKEFYKEFESLAEELMPFVEQDWRELLKTTPPSQGRCHRHGNDRESRVEQLLRATSCKRSITQLLFNKYFRNAADSYTFVRGFAHQYGCYWIRPKLAAGQANDGCVMTDDDVATVSASVDPPPPSSEHHSSSTERSPFKGDDVFATRCHLRVHNQHHYARRRGDGERQNRVDIIRHDVEDEKVRTALDNFNEKMRICERMLRQRCESFVPFSHLRPTSCF